MQKKHFIFVIVSLALLSTILSVPRRNPQYSVSNLIGRNSMMIGDDVYTEDMMVNKVPTEVSLINSGAQRSIVDKESTMMIETPPMYFADDALDVEDRSYEKSSYHAVVVKDVTKYVRGLKEYFASIGGVILSSSVSSEEKYNSAYLYVKVPVDKFDEATNRASEEVKKIIDESINAYDITGQVVNVKETLQTLHDRLAVKEAELAEAKNEVEKARIKIEIDRLERQIAAAEKNQGRVESRSEYASISISVADSELFFNPNSTGDFRFELLRAWESLKSLLKVLMVYGIWFAVYSVVWAPGVWILSKVIYKLK